MFSIDNLPIEIQKRISYQNYTIDNTGESDSNVILFENMALKIEKTSNQSNREYEILRWLDGRLSVPKVIEFVQQSGFNYLLMSRLQGSMLCSDDNMKNPDTAVQLLAEGLKLLWSIDISHCPYSSRLEERLETAKYNLEHNLVDVENFEEDTLGENGFADVNALYEFLVHNQPDEDLVFTHGDYCLPNIFVDGNAISFLDLGKAGIADRWQDLALCIRSLKYNLCELCSVSEDEFERLRNKIYAVLDVKEDCEKLKYYILLDELF